MLHVHVALACVAFVGAVVLGHALFQIRRQQEEEEQQCHHVGNGTYEMSASDTVRRLVAQARGQPPDQPADRATSTDTPEGSTITYRRKAGPGQPDVEYRVSGSMRYRGPDGAWTSAPIVDIAGEGGERLV